MKLLALAAVVVAAAFPACTIQADTAQAHRSPTASVPNLHRVWSWVKDKIVNPVPFPIPECDWSKRGMQIELEDPQLDAIVTWECYCWNEVNCHWRRLMIRPKDAFNWQPERRRYVWDYQRRCDSIVCKREKVKHYWPTLYAQGGKLAAEALEGIL